MEGVKSKPNYWILGINLLVTVSYNLVSRLLDPKGGWGDMVCIILHVIGCIIVGIVCAFLPQYKKQVGMWFLSSLLVLILGFSTCVGIYIIRI
jgi:hypothetical protein